MISTKSHSEPKKLELKIDNINIEYVNFFNFLGLTIDSRLTWENHTINMSNKCLRIIGTLNRIKYFVPLNIRLMLYNTLILPHLNYCVTAWGYQCNRIIKLQKKAIRTVMISSYNAHTEPFFKNLKLLKIQDILTLQTLKIYHKFRNNNLPNYIQNWPLFQNSNIHNHNTRGANALHKNRCSHVFAQKSLKLNITNIVNGTPDIILDKIDTHSLHGFTNYVKLFLLQTYQDTCTVPNCYICSLSNTLNT